MFGRLASLPVRQHKKQSIRKDDELPMSVWKKNVCVFCVVLLMKRPVSSKTFKYNSSFCGPFVNLPNEVFSSLTAFSNLILLFIAARLETELPFDCPDLLPFGFLFLV